MILGYTGKPVSGLRVLILPLLASVIMLAWDLSMDPTWSMLDRAWIWQQGGSYFGVPVSNFFGWFLTAYLYYQAFALYCRAKAIASGPQSQRFWLPAILFYAVCGLGNILILKQPMVPPVATDPAGKQWLASDILGNCVLVSLLVMVPFSALAFLRTAEQPANTLRASRVSSQAITESAGRATFLSQSAREKCNLFNRPGGQTCSGQCCQFLHRS